MARPPHPTRRRPRPAGTRRPLVRPFLLGGVFLLALVGILLLPLLGDGEPLPPGVPTRGEAGDVPSGTASSTAPRRAEQAGDRDATERSIAAVEASATTNGALPIAPRGHLLVRVVDDASGEPIAGAEVAASLDRDEPVPAAELRQWQAIADPFERLRAGGQAATTDSQGYAALRGSHWMQVMARHGDLSGAATIELEAVGAEGFLLRLHRERLLEVAIFDALRRPLADVPLGLAIHTTSPKTHETSGREVEIGATDTTGMLRLQVDRHLRRGERTSNLEVFVAAPGLRATRSKVDATRTRVDIVLPDYGSVVIQVVGPDGAIPADDPVWSVRLTAAATSEDGTNSSEDDQAWGNGHGGEVLFPYVGLGFEVFACAQLGGLEHEERVPGPLRSQESVQHRLVMPTASCARLRGRLLDEHGKPWANTWIVAGRRGRSLWASQARTDGAGEIRMRIAAVDDASALHLAARDSNGPFRSSREFLVTPGLEVDLGNVVLPRGDEIARVTVVEERSTPPGFRLHVERSIDDDWRWSTEHRVERIDDTSFAIRGMPTATGRQLRLCVEAPGCEAISPIAFASGADLTIHLRHGLAVTARILVSQETLAEIENESCTLVMTDELGNDHYLDGRIQGDAWLVEFHGARAGRYRLAVEYCTTVAMLEDVVVAPESPPDPRLDPWDLRDAIQPLRIHCVDAAGQPVPASGDLLAQTRSGDWEWVGWFHRGLCRTLVPRRPMELLVQFEDGGFARTTNAMDTVQVVAPTPHRTWITLQGMPELVPDAPIEVDVVIAEAELRARGLPDVSLLGPVTWLRAQHTLSFDLFAPAFGRVRFLRLGPDDRRELLEELPCALSAGEATVLTVPDSVRERLQPWTQPR